MSLILDALKKVQRKRADLAGVPGVLVAGRNASRDSPTRVIYLMVAVPVLICIGYLVLRYSNMLGNPMPRTANQKSQMRVGTEQAASAREQVATESKSKEPVQGRVSVEELLPNRGPAQIKKEPADPATEGIIASERTEYVIPGQSSEKDPPSSPELSSVAPAVSEGIPVKGEPVKGNDEQKQPLQLAEDKGNLSGDIPKASLGTVMDPVERQIRLLVSRNQIEMPLALALMEQESRLNPRSVSKAGAAGLCQLMPETARELGLMVPRYRNPEKPTVDSTRDERFDPFRAMEVAFSHLRKLLEKYDGNVPLALSAYNAGMGVTGDRVARIDETAAYVSDIMTYYWRYQDKTALQQAIARLVTNIKSPPALKPEDQHEPEPAEQVVSEPSEPVVFEPSKPVASTLEDDPPSASPPPSEHPTETPIVTPDSEIREEQKQEEKPAADSGTQEVEKIDEAGEPAKQDPKIDLTMKKADYHFNVGVFYQSQGSLQKALAEYREVVRLDPANVQAHNNMGVIYKETGFYDEAIQKYREALSVNPRYEKALSNLGVALYLKGDLESAVREFQRSAEINPGNPAVYVNLGLTYKKQGLMEDAIRTFQKAISIDSQYPEAYYNLALTFGEIEDTEKAVTYYRKFLVTAKGKYPALAKKVESFIKEGGIKQ